MRPVSCCGTRPPTVCDSERTPPCNHPYMDSPRGTPITVPVLTGPDVRLRPFWPEDAAWVYYVSLDPDCVADSPCPTRTTARTPGTSSTRSRSPVPVQAKEPTLSSRTETEIGLGWVGFHRITGN